VKAHSRSLARHRPWAASPCLHACPPPTPPHPASPRPPRAPTRAPRSSAPSWVASWTGGRRGGAGGAAAGAPRARLPPVHSPRPSAHPPPPERPPRPSVFPTPSLPGRYKAKEGRDFAPAEDPGVLSVRRIYSYYKTHGWVAAVARSGDAAAGASQLAARRAGFEHGVGRRCCRSLLLPTCLRKPSHSPPGAPPPPHPPPPLPHPPTHPPPHPPTHPPPPPNTPPPPPATPPS
jgi:hypothetical protein